MISQNHITRLSKYKSVLKQLKRFGMIKVFAENISDASGVSAVQIRKDFSIFGIMGNKKGGYVISELIQQIENKLGVSQERDVILVGYGNIGMALVKFPGFASEHINIVAAFDVDDAKLNPKAETPILSIDELEAFVKKNNIKMAILAIPDLVAQDMFDLLVEYGIRGVLNFSSTNLKADLEIFVNNIDLTMALETVIFYTHAAKNSDEG